MLQGDMLIHDWNRTGAQPPSRIELNDDTLRDGLQSPSVRTPSIDRKLRLLELIDRAGIESANIGFPAAGQAAADDVEQLAREIGRGRLRVRPTCAARMLTRDVRAIADIVQRTGQSIECGCFIGASAVRRLAEGWRVDDVRRRAAEVIGGAAGQGLPVMYVAEDATRTDPDTLGQLIATAIDAGASRVCLADTVGHAMPSGVRALVRFVRGLIDRTDARVGLDWHGHRDRDLATINSLTALEAGARRVHGTVLGIGERAGNTPIDLLLVNLVLVGWLDRDLTGVADLVREVSDATGEPIPDNYPVFGRNAFRTASGVHAAAVTRALQQDADLADAVYSSVPARLIGRTQEIAIGPMSGRSNVIAWLTRHGVEPNEDLVSRLVAVAKRSTRVLTDAEMHLEVDAVRAAQTHSGT